MAILRLRNTGRDMKDYAKFISLYAYNWDSQNNNFRKYRQVFDRWEIKYIGVDLSFYNKRFDEEDWKVKVSFKAFLMKKGNKEQELCNLEEEVTVPKGENLITLNKGWGNDEAGKGWEKGEYCWEAYLDDECIGTTKFYIEDAGVVNRKTNPYFQFLTLKLYEGPDAGVADEDRKYGNKFVAENTRFIFGEFRFVNQLRKPWACELFLTFYDDTRQLIGRITFFDHISSEEPGEDVFTITEGWGSEQARIWQADNYTLEVEFQEQVLAVVPFTVMAAGRENISEEGFAGDSENETDKINIDELVAKTLAEARMPDGDPESFDDLNDQEKQEDDPKDEITKSLKELDELIGLESIKSQIREHISYLDFLKVRKEMGIDEEEELSLHSVFTGNPGTGKTTVVKLLGKIYKAMGLLTEGNVHVVDCSDIVSGYVRQTGKTTKDEIEKARGGILFIDEAYMLYRKGVENDFGVEAIAELITEMSDGEGNIAIMVAGYPAEMQEMINSNPGLKSRFKHYFHFDDYSPSELTRIAEYAAGKKKISFTDGARKLLEVELLRAYRMRDRTFGNARFVHGVVDEAKINMGVRVMRKLKASKPDMAMLSTVEEEDVKEIFEDKGKFYVDIPPDEELLADALAQLDHLTGLQNIKDEIRNIIKLVRYYREIKRDVRKAFPIHSVFSGNPGTGKTTLARIIGNLYRALGILERGHLVESDASDLIAGFLGQTALKTKERIQEAMGGVLFIDEAYSLMDGQHPDFGRKAIETLIKMMDDRRGEFAVIVAGYPKPMQQFLESNPGMQSRFDQTFVFHDFSQPELYTIAVNMLTNAELTLDEQSDAYLKEYLSYLHQNRNLFFGNARSVRKVIDRIVIRQNLRMACMSPEGRTEDAIRLVIMDDMADFRMDPFPAGRGIGFRTNK